jgi:hypothetical protein
MYTKNEIMFPHHVISSLRHARGDKWQRLIDQVANKPETSVEVLALMSLMIQLNGCMQCETDSYRADIVATMTNSSKNTKQNSKVYVNSQPKTPHCRLS